MNAEMYGTGMKKEHEVEIIGGKACSLRFNKHACTQMLRVCLCVYVCMHAFTYGQLLID